MGGYYDEIEIEDMVWDEKAKVFHYPCPCGDRFEISRGQLANYEDIATCPSCSLIIRVIYDPLDYEDYEEEEDDDEASSAEESEPKEEDDHEDSATTKKAPAAATASQLSAAIAKLNSHDENKPSDHISAQEVVKEPIDAYTTAGDIRGNGEKLQSPGGGIGLSAQSASVD